MAKNFVAHTKRGSIVGFVLLAVATVAVLLGTVAIMIVDVVTPENPQRGRPFHIGIFACPMFLISLLTGATIWQFRHLGKQRTLIADDVGIRLEESGSDVGYIPFANLEKVKSVRAEADQNSVIGIILIIVDPKHPDTYWPAKDLKAKGKEAWLPRDWEGHSKVDVIEILRKFELRFINKNEDRQGSSQAVAEKNPFDFK